MAGAVAIIGDSHVGALAAPLRAALAPSGIALADLSRIGWTTGRYLREGDVSGWARTTPAQLVFIVLGTNDWGVTGSAYMSNVRAVAQAALAGGARVVWVGPPAVTRTDIAAGVSRAADNIRAALAGTGVGWLDSRGLPVAFRDQVHLTPAGYKTWAQALANVATRELAPVVATPAAVPAPTPRPTPAIAPARLPVPPMVAKPRLPSAPTADYSLYAGLGIAALVLIAGALALRR